MYDIATLGVEALIARVDSLRADVDTMRPLDPDQAGKAMQRLRLEWTYHSNAIEGNSLTYGETRALLLHGVTAAGKPLKDHLDIKGHKEALDYLGGIVQAQEPLTLAFIREMHKLLLGDPYESWAETADGQRVKRTITPGEFKTQPNHVVTATGEIHYYASPGDVPALMADLVDWQRETWPKVESGEVQPLPFAADLHHRFAAIHPFDDGNGRMARLLMNLVLMRAGYVPAVLRQENRPAYYGALAQADSGDLGPVVRFVAEELEGTLQLYLRALRNEPDPDAFEKHIALLKQQVKAAGATSPSTQQDLARIGQSFVRPLLDRLQSRSELARELFDEVEDDIRLDGHRITPMGKATFSKIISRVEDGMWNRIDWERRFSRYLINPEIHRSVSTKVSLGADSRIVTYKVGNVEGIIRYDDTPEHDDALDIADACLSSLMDEINALHESAVSHPRSQS